MEYNFILTFSLVITFLSFLGFPQFIDDTVYFFFGLAIAVLAYRIRVKHRAEQLPQTVVKQTQTIKTSSETISQTNQNDIV